MRALRHVFCTGVPRVSQRDEAPVAHCGDMSFNDTASGGSLPACLSSSLSWESAFWDHLSDNLFAQEPFSQGQLPEEPRFEDRGVVCLPCSSPQHTAREWAHHEEHLLVIHLFSCVCRALPSPLGPGLA